jgi:hypothetical protein
MCVLLSNATLTVMEQLLAGSHAGEDALTACKCQAAATQSLLSRVCRLTSTMLLLMLMQVVSWLLTRCAVHDTCLAPAV